MSNIAPGSATLPLTSGVLRQHADAGEDDESGDAALIAGSDRVHAPGPSSTGSWNPIGIGTAAAGTAMFALGGSMMASRRVAAGAPFALLGAAGAIVGGLNLRSGGAEPSAGSKLDGIRVSDQTPGELSVSYGDVDDPRLAPVGSDRTNRPKVDFTKSGTAQAREGVVQIRSRVGDYLDLGSGWVVEPGLVVTNHHVVASNARASSMVARDHTGTEHAARLVADDPEHDLALISVPGLQDAPLPMDDVVERGEMARVTGYPGDTFRETLAVAMLGADVTDKGVKRDGLLFAGRSAPGASGGPIINASGEVVATTFAIGANDIETDEYSGPIVMGVTNGDVRELVDWYASGE